jgi:hypothetical protein
MVPDHILADFRRYLRAAPIEQQSTAGYARWYANKGGAADTAPRPERRLVKRPAPSRPAKSRRRDPAPSAIAYDGPPRAIPFPKKTAVGSVDFDLLVVGRGMARDAGEMRRGGRSMSRDQSGQSLSKLQTWARERMSPDDCAMLDEMIGSVMKDHQRTLDQREQKNLTEFLRKRGFSDGEIERARDLIVADVEIPTVERGQQGGEYGPEAWWTTRGRDRRARDADPPPQHEVETTDAEHSPPHGPYDMPGEEEEEPMEPCDVPQGLAFDPPVSRAQQQLMCAAARGQSTSGVWEGSNRPPSRRASFEEPEDTEEDRKLKAILSRFSNLNAAGIRRALELTREARRKQSAETSGSLDEPPDFPGKPRPGGGMVGDRALPSFESLFPEAARLAPSTRTLVRTFLR